MQPIKQLSRVLASLAPQGRALFSLTDLRAALPEHTAGAFRAVVARAAVISADKAIASASLAKRPST